MKLLLLLFKFIFIENLFTIHYITLWNIQSKLPSSNISDYFPNEITKIYDTDYELLYHVGNKDRFYLEYNQIPTEIINSFLSAEDKNFFSHPGVDARNIQVNIR